MALLLSKSDFKAARNCPTKLFYKKSGYPSIDAENDYLELLAEGGFMVEKMAKLLFPEGEEVDFGGPSEVAGSKTMEALQAANTTLFEATLISAGKLARVDILKKEGNSFQIIEVKAKSYDSVENQRAVADGAKNVFRSKRGGAIKADWIEYLEDVAFQVAVLRELFPNASVAAFLAMPDKSKTTRIEDLHSLFKLRREIDSKTGFERLSVEFIGDVERLRRDNFVTLVPITDEVRELLPAVKHAAEKFATSISPKLTKISTPISVACRDCEYRKRANDSRDGFLECWGALGEVQPNILDLYHVGQIGSRSEPLANKLISERKVSLFDVPRESLVKADGKIGENNKRQIIQIDYTREQKEFVGPDLAPFLQHLTYPLHFVDFETATLAIPYHAGMRPYEEVAFQWSCHTVPLPDAAPTHSEWINVREAFPNFEFASSLMKQIGDTGSVLVWATHENTILSRILEQMVTRDFKNDSLRTWLQIMTDKSKSPRLVDMNAVTRKSYFHPVMKGKTSVKKVCDAIWKENASLREAFPEYVRAQGDSFASPYDVLPTLEISGTPLVVAEGTGAIRAYEAMVYGVEKDKSETVEQWKRLLLQYCKLDTLAMVMIWKHWRQITGLK